MSAPLPSHRCRSGVEVLCRDHGLGPARSLRLYSDVREVGIAQVDLFDRRRRRFGVAERDGPHSRAEVGRDVHAEAAAPRRRKLLLPRDEGLERHGVAGEVRPAAEASLVQPASDLSRK